VIIKTLHFVTLQIPFLFNVDNVVVLFKIVKTIIFYDVIKVALSLINNSLKFEKPFTFNFENIVILSDVISFASMFLNQLNKLFILF
jgi:hypothetical protein